MKGRFWRKALAAALALLVVSGNVPIRSVADLFGGAAITANAEEGEAASGQCGENAFWSFDTATGKLTISGTGAMADYEYDFGTDTMNSPWYVYKDDITSVEIKTGINYIGISAFYSFQNIESITIPNSVTKIGSDAFYGCTGLTSITIPENVTSIASGLFYGCTGLTSITIPNGVTSIGNYAFYGCESLTTVTLPKNLSSIGELTFKGCTSLESITIPASVTEIGSDAFFGCTGLTSITIPENVTSIAPELFYECTGLKSITIPESVTEIGYDAFYECTGVTDVYCYADPDKLTWDEVDCDDFIRSETGKPTICHVREEYLGKYNGKFGSTVNVTFKGEAMDKCGDHAYWCFESDTGKLTISGTGDMANYDFDAETGVITSPWYAYKDNITSVKIESGIISIGNLAFYECTSFTSITIPDSVTSIGDQAFQGCTSLKSVTIPDSVTSIGNQAFQGCTSLTSITIPNSVTSIGRDAFYNCTNIKDVYCYAGPEKLTWNEDSCDDFIKTPKHTTVCHVPEEHIETYGSKFSDVNVRFVGDLVDMGLGEHLYGHSITLDGSIGVNFYVELTDELLASETAEMVFTVPNGSKTDTQTLLVKDVIAVDSNKVSIGSKTYYKFKCSVSAKDMASEITAQLVDGEKSGTEYKYSVKDYADYLLAHTEVEEYANAAPLVKAMLNYGAASQTYFKEGAVIGEVENMTDVTVPNTFKFDEVSTSLPEGVTFEGATLSLKSETTLSLYFKGLPADTKFICDGKTVETANNGEYVVARIRGIKASELENDFTVTFKGESMTYNVMAYCYNVLNGGTEDEKLQNVCKALYLYAQAAINYAG